MDCLSLGFDRHSRSRVEKTPVCPLVLSYFPLSPHNTLIFCFSTIAELWFVPCEYGSLKSGGVQLGFELTHFLRYTSYLIHPAFPS